MAAHPATRPILPGAYFLGKCVFGFLYYRWLESAGFATPAARLRAYLIFTPLIKLYHFHKRGIYSHGTFLFSVAHDCIMSSLFFMVSIHLRGAWYALMPFLSFPPQFILELVGFKMLLPNEKFIVKPVNLVDPAAFFGLGVFMIALLAHTADHVKHPLHHDFAAFVGLLLWTDLQFGVTHYLSHCIPWLWERHRVHHEYGKGELNGWANLHGEAFDNLQMNGVLLLPLLVCAGPLGLYASTLPFSEWFYLIPFTHFRFQVPTCTLRDYSAFIL